MKTCFSDLLRKPAGAVRQADIYVLPLITLAGRVPSKVCTLLFNEGPAVSPKETCAYGEGCRDIELRTEPEARPWGLRLLPARLGAGTEVCPKMRLRTRLCAKLVCFLQLLRTPQQPMISFSDEDAHSCCGSTVYQVWQAVLDKTTLFKKRFFFLVWQKSYYSEAEKASDKNIRKGDGECLPLFSKRFFM